MYIWTPKQPDGSMLRYAWVVFLLSGKPEEGFAGVSGNLLPETDMTPKQQ